MTRIFHSYPAIIYMTFLTISIVYGSSHGSSRESEIALYKDLVLNYGPTTYRPVRNKTLPIIVKLRMLVDHLIDFDEPKQEITLFSSVKMIWKDEYLTWNTSDYGGVDFMEINVDDIWYPDVTLLSATSPDYLPMYTRRVFVTPDGNVSWLSPVIFKTQCVLNVILFPFDLQNCTITLGSFSSTSDLIDVDFFFEKNVTSSHRFYNNGVWRITSDSAEKVLQMYSSSDKPFAEIHYFITFARISRVYVLSIIFPSILLSLTTLLIFILPPESGEKISLGITNLLAMVVFQELVFSAMPPSGSPKLANNICVMVAISCLGIFFETVAQRMYSFSDNKPVPRWLYRLLIKNSNRKKFDHLSNYPSLKQDRAATIEMRELRKGSLDDTGFVSNVHSELDGTNEVNQNKEVIDDGENGVGMTMSMSNRSPGLSVIYEGKGEVLSGPGSRESRRLCSRRFSIKASNSEVWKIIAVSFEQKVAYLLLLSIVVSIVATGIEMVYLVMEQYKT